MTALPLMEKLHERLFQEFQQKISISSDLVRYFHQKDDLPIELQQMTLETAPSTTNIPMTKTSPPSSTSGRSLNDIQAFDEIMECLEHGRLLNEKILREKL